MTKDEALKLALDALESVLDDSPKVLDASISGGLYEVFQCREAITAIKEALAQPERKWVGLTETDILAASKHWRNAEDFLAGVYWAAGTLKEFNT